MKKISQIAITLLLIFVCADSSAKGKKNNKNNNNNGNGGNQFNNRINGLKKQIKETEKDITENQKKIDAATSGKSTSHAFSGTDALEKRKKSLATILERYQKRLEEAEDDKRKATERNKKNNNNNKKKK